MKDVSKMPVMGQDDFLIYLTQKRFSVYVSGEFERFTDFWGVMKILAHYSDFFEYTKLEREGELLSWYSDREIYVDANIYLKFK
jgi:hypothetical protein